MRATLPGTGTPWTKIPNVLADRLLPGLSDTELRVLIVLIRATTGWRRDGRSVELTYRNLTRLTGRHTEALSRAIASLGEKGLIHVLGGRPSRFPKRGAPEGERATNKDR